MTEFMETGGLKISLMIPETDLFLKEAGSVFPKFIIYVHEDPDGASQVFAILSDCMKKGTIPPAVLVSVSGEDWNRDMSPWPAEKVFRAGEDFSGGADAYLDKLEHTVIPEAEAHIAAFAKSLGLEFPEDPVRILGGYSLAGLFTLYAACRTGVFRRFAAMSGSYWFDGFLNYADARLCVSGDGMPPLPECIYLSLGDREKKTKNPRMAAVEDCANALTELIRSRGVPVIFELNPGNHFMDVPVRISKGLLWCLSGDRRV